jgi:hypothetical protein
MGHVAIAGLNLAVLPQPSRNAPASGTGCGHRSGIGTRYRLTSWN